MPILDFENTTNTNNRIKVIGVGGGGGNAVGNMFKEGIVDVDFILVNTDAQMLGNSPVPVKIQIGETGLGAGNRPEVAKEAAIESVDKIKTLLEDNTDMVFITAGMGGGTGTGAAPVIASIARDLGILTVGIVTLPFSFEGPKRINQAQKGIEELGKFVDTIIIIINDKIREIYQDMKFSEGFRIADNILTTAAKGIAELITLPGYVNVDFEDVKQVMQNGGKALMTSGTASGENRALECCENALNSPLIADNSIRGAKNILLNIACSKEHEMSMNELSDISDFVKEVSGIKTDVIWGSCYDEELGDQLKVTIIATGFSKNKENEQAEKVEVINLYETKENKTSKKTENKASNEFVRITNEKENLEEDIPLPDFQDDQNDEIVENREKKIVIQLGEEIDTKAVNSEEKRSDEAFCAENFERINKISTEDDSKSSRNQQTSNELEVGSFSFNTGQAEEDKHFLLSVKKAKERLNVKISKDENALLRNKELKIERITSGINEEEVKNQRETLYSEEKHTSKEIVEYDEESNEVVIKENKRYIDKRED